MVALVRTVAQVRSCGTVPLKREILMPFASTKLGSAAHGMLRRRKFHQCSARGIENGPDVASADLVAVSWWYPPSQTVRLEARSCRHD